MVDRQLYCSDPFEEEQNVVKTRETVEELLTEKTALLLAETDLALPCTAPARKLSSLD